MDLVQDGEEDQHLFWVDVDDILPDTEDNGSQFSGDRDSVLGVLSLVLLGLSWKNDVPVDSSWLNSSHHMDQEFTITHGFVLEVFNVWDLSSNSGIAPCNELVLGLSSNK